MWGGGGGVSDMHIKHFSAHRHTGAVSLLSLLIVAQSGLYGSCHVHILIVM